MATPAIITVTGTYLRPDGTPDTGSVTFESRTFVRQAAGNDVVAPGPVTEELDALGDVSLAVPATNDPAWSPTGWTYRVTVQLSSVRISFNAAIPYDAPGGVLDLSDLLPAQAADGELYAAFAHVHAGHVVTADLDDYLPKAGGTVTGALVVDGVLRVGTSVTLEIGPDINLYRVSADHLGTDDSLAVGGDLLVYGNVDLQGNIAGVAVADVSGLQGALDAKLDKAGGTITDSTLEVLKGDGTSGIRFRSTGGAVDIDKRNGDIVVGSWAGPGYSGTQTPLQRWRNNGTTFAGVSSYGSTVYTNEQFIDASAGIAALGAKNGLTNLRFAGYKGTAGAPTTGTWITGDMVMDSAKVWWRCSAGGTPGTWT